MGGGVQKIDFHASRDFQALAVLWYNEGCEGTPAIDFIRDCQHQKQICQGTICQISLFPVQDYVVTDKFGACGKTFWMRAGAWFRDCHAGGMPPLGHVR